MSDEYSKEEIDRRLTIYKRVSDVVRKDKYDVALAILEDLPDTFTKDPFYAKLAIEISKNLGQNDEADYYLEKLVEHCYYNSDLIPPMTDATDITEEGEYTEEGDYSEEESAEPEHSRPTAWEEGSYLDRHTETYVPDAPDPEEETYTPDEDLDEDTDLSVSIIMGEASPDESYTPDEDIDLSVSDEMEEELESRIVNHYESSADDSLEEDEDEGYVRPSTTEGIRPEDVKAKFGYDDYDDYRKSIRTKVNDLKSLPVTHGDPTVEITEEPEEEPEDNDYASQDERDDEDVFRARMNLTLERPTVLNTELTTKRMKWYLSTYLHDKLPEGPTEELADRIGVTLKTVQNWYDGESMPITKNGDALLKELAGEEFAGLEDFFIQQSRNKYEQLMMAEASSDS